MSMTVSNATPNPWSNRLRTRLIGLKKSFRYENGRLYYDRRLERCALFFLTMLLLAWGLFDKI